MKSKLLLFLTTLPLMVACGPVSYAEGCEKGAVNATFRDLKEHASSSYLSMTSTGNQKVLIIPIWFTDSSNYISDKEGLRDDIRKAYLGTNEETGWRSVKTFYEEESWGALHLDGVVTDWYEPEKTHKYYSDSSGKTSIAIKDAVAWYKQTTGDDCKQFDSDGDGFIDAVVMIYAYKNYANLKDSSKSNLWAYCFFTNGIADKDNPVPSTYFWASYDFMYGKDKGGYGDTGTAKLDTHTFIHEMGHILGADDYYDYAQVEMPAGGFSMQDYNVGGHDPFSRLGYGWTKPLVPTQSCDVKVGLFEKTGDLILLSPKYEGSIFDEYILLELYSPTGVNEFDSKERYNFSYPLGPNKVGFRIWHIDTRLCWSDGGSYGSSNITNQIEDGKVYQIACTNTTYGTEDAKGHTSPIPSFVYFNQLKLLRRDGNGKTFEENDLWLQGDTFSLNEFSSQFYNKTKLDCGSKLGWKVEFTEITDEGATVRITKA